MKIIINYEPSNNPKNDDLLVWDNYGGKFKVVSKASFFSASNERIRLLEEQLKKQQDLINQLIDDNKKLANIILEEM